MRLKSCSLSILLKGLTYELIQGELEVLIEKITPDSREIESNALFVAIKGLNFDGHSFVEKAIKAGAKVVVIQEIPQKLIGGITYLKFTNTAIALGEMLSAYYGHPSKKLQLIGITGTNGKTSIATLLFKLFSKLGYPCGLISTVENRILDEIIPASHTTPDPTKLHHLIYEMKNKGVDYCFMEVSSHSQSQYRTSGLQFSLGLFTNLTHDHLDYHGNFKNYLQAKKSFFDNLSINAVAISNLDDKNGRVMLQNTKAHMRFYSLWKDTDYKGHILSNEFTGLHLRIGQLEMYSPLVGKFNASNLMAVYAAGRELGIENVSLIQGLSALGPAAGRFEVIRNTEMGVTGIVDYAHTPDALENVLTTIQEVKTKAGSIISVVGCGGDRDRSKRTIMSQIAYKKSDILILTSDNPRSEDPNSILDEMEAGLSQPYEKVCMRVLERRMAIQTAVKLSKRNDVILIAGKGHETYQEINGIKYQFDDREELKAAFHHDK